MRKRTRYLLAVFLVMLVVASLGLAAALISAPVNAQQPAAVEEGPLTWDVIASGGTTMSSSSFVMLSTTGQPLAGPSSNSEHTLISGFWQAFVNKVLLPIFLR